VTANEEISEETSNKNQTLKQMALRLVQAMISEAKLNSKRADYIKEYLDQYLRQVEESDLADGLLSIWSKLEELPSKC
jgi:hypothetical protein